jgi:hypothetical protein
MNTKTAGFLLPITKTGNDLRSFLQEAKGNNYKGLLLYAEQLYVAATICEALAAEVKGERSIQIHADATYISVAGPAAWIDKLVKAGLLHEDIEEEE